MLSRASRFTSHVLLPLYPPTPFIPLPLPFAPDRLSRTSWLSSQSQTQNSELKTQNFPALPPGPLTCALFASGDPSGMALRWSI